MHRTLKSERLRGFVLPLRKEAMLAELELAACWYNEHRPHARHHGATPAEMRDGKKPANEARRFETRPRLVSAAKLRAKPGIRLKLHVDFLEGRRHLPVVTLKRAA